MPPVAWPWPLRTIGAFAQTAAGQPGRSADFQNGLGCMAGDHDPSSRGRSTRTCRGFGRRPRHRQSKILQFSRMRSSRRGAGAPALGAEHQILSVKQNAARNAEATVSFTNANPSRGFPRPTCCLRISSNGNLLSCRFKRECGRRRTLRRPTRHQLRGRVARTQGGQRSY